MNERAKVTVSWLVTVIFLPIIGFMGIRMVNSIDEIALDLNAVKIEQAVARADQNYVKESLDHLKSEVDALRSAKQTLNYPNGYRPRPQDR